MGTADTFSTMKGKMLDAGDDDLLIRRYELLDNNLSQLENSLTLTEKDNENLKNMKVTLQEEYNRMNKELKLGNEQMGAITDLQESGLSADALSILAIYLKFDLIELQLS